MSGVQLVKKGGKPVFNQKFEDIKSITDDDDIQFVVKKDGKWGFYDKDGKAVTSMIFDDYSSGYSTNPYVELNEEEYAIFSLFNNGMMILEKDDKMGCLDTNGNVVIPFVYEGMAFTPKGNLLVKKDGKIGAIDGNGKEIIPCKYDDINFDTEEKKLILKTIEFFDL